MTTNANPDIAIEEAESYAREAIRETWPATREVADPTAGMYEFDAIIIDDEICPTSSVSIMHDPEANTFALVENARTKATLKAKVAPTAPTLRLATPIDWDKLAEEHAVAYLRGDLATSSPESYTIEEMKEISDGMAASTAEVEEAMRRDLAELPAHAQARMLDLLQEADSEHFSWWVETLAERTPEHADKFFPRQC